MADATVLCISSEVGSRQMFRHLCTKSVADVAASASPINLEVCHLSNGESVFYFLASPTFVTVTVGPGNGMKGPDCSGRGLTPCDGSRASESEDEALRSSGSTA
jgi:hypothetical protein